jgi:hypothetical protein
VYLPRSAIIGISWEEESLGTLAQKSSILSRFLETSRTMLMNQITDYNFVAGITSDVIFNVKNNSRDRVT